MYTHAHTHTELLIAGYSFTLYIHGEVCEVTMYKNHTNHDPAHLKYHVFLIY